MMRSILTLTTVQICLSVTYLLFIDICYPCMDGMYVLMNKTSVRWAGSLTHDSSTEQIKVQEHELARFISSITTILTKEKDEKNLQILNSFKPTCSGM